MAKYERKPIMAVAFLLSGIMVLISVFVQLTLKNYFPAGFQFLVALMFLFDAYVYNKPYVSMDEEKLIVINGFVKTIILFKDITEIDEKNNKLMITYKRGSYAMRLRVVLSQLKKQDRDSFLKDLKSKLPDKITQ